MDYYHIPVMLNESIDALNIKPDGVYLDGTLGGGGHSHEIAKRLGADGKLIVIDKDKSAIEAGKSKLSEFKSKITYIHDDFKNFDDYKTKMKIADLDGVLLDLGVSSYQIDEPDRGFSYMQDAKLDMRMNKEQELNAFRVINDYSEKDLIKIFYEYGEESYAKVIAANIVKTRQTSPINTTGELSHIVENSIPYKDRYRYGHPAKRVFQAVRIEVNNELGELGEALKSYVRWLNPGGRIAVISFHSLEDRIVKETFAELSSNCICDKKLPICVCGHKAVVKQITKKPILPTLAEVSRNSRAGSAHLRIAEKI